MDETTARITGAAPRRWCAAGAVRLALGAILLIAAALKAQQLATEPVNQCAQWRCRLVPLAQVEFELLLGVWLLSGLAEFASRVTAGVCFGAFLAVAAHRGWTGEYSCGCFGRVEVNPWATAALDAAAVAALLIFRRSRGGPTGRRALKRVALAGAIALAAGAAAAWPILTYAPATLAADGRIVGDSRNVLLRPNRWTGTRLPLLRHIQIDADLARGRWQVVLFHWRCRACRELVGQLVEKSPGLAAEQPPVRVAVIHLPPLPGPGEDPIPPDPPFAQGRLDESRRWFAATPVILHLDDGKVTRVQTKAP